MLKIVCFGDSMTDACLTFGSKPYGEGYVLLLAERLEGQAQLVNAGVTSQRIVDLNARVDGVIKENPNEIFILVGVNDSWRRFDHAGPWTTDEEFEKTYFEMVHSLKKGCPKAHIALLTPYVLPISDFNKLLAGDLAGKIAITKKVAEKENLELIDLNEAMQAAYKRKDGVELTMVDGVHPKGQGCVIIADLIIDSLKKRNLVH